MGAKFGIDPNLRLDIGECWLPIHGICNYMTTESGKGKILEYHKSWDWLIPVVEKIEKQGSIIQISFSGITNCKIIVGNFKEPIITVANTESQNSIEAIYLAVVDYIKYYNKHN